MSSYSVQERVKIVEFYYVSENANFLNNLIMSDEAHFHLNGYVNKQNCRIWGTENPRALHQRQLHPLRCTVWCGIMADKVIGPYFFENERNEPETVSGAVYRTMLENFLRPIVLNNRNIWFQQDGATAHTARATMAVLRESVSPSWPTLYILYV